MNRLIISIALILTTLYLHAGDSVYHCSGHRSFGMNGVPTHVRDSALLSYDISYYGISLEVSDTSTFIRGYTDIKALALEDIDELVFELSSSMGVDSIFIGEQKADSFVHTMDLIRILPQSPPVRDEWFIARVYYQGTGGQGGFFSGISNGTATEWGKRVTYTLSEPFGSLGWFVCKQVLSDKADSADIFLTVADDRMAGSNGILVGVDSLPGNRARYHWRSRYPIAYYLLSLSVSDYQDYSYYTRLPSTTDSLLIQNYIYNAPGYLETNRQNIDETGNLIRLYSDLFSPYPFRDEKYGHCLAPIGGGMEHQTMTTLQNFNFDLVAHELVHQWFGDNVTCASWQDIWVNEGFASYGEFLAREALLSREEAAGWMMYAHERALSKPEGSIYIPKEDARDEYRIFSTELSYKKGAAIIHMIRYELENDSLFFETLSTFQERFADSVATGADFLAVLDEISGSGYDWFFDQWYYGKGYPEFQFIWWQTADSLIVEIQQSGSSEETPFFRTSFDLGFLLESGADTIVRILVDQPVMKVLVPLHEPVIDLVPDPDNWVLEESSVIRKFQSKSYLSVNPNPFGDELNVVFRNGTGDREIVLSDMSGKIIAKRQTTSDRFSLPTMDLRQGFYLLWVTEGDERYATRVIKQ